MDDLREYLYKRLLQPLPGSRAQMLLEPPMSYGRHRGPARDDARRAAVMILLHDEGDEITVPMVKRREDLAYHPGEMAFPGGGIEPGESWEQAAVRECCEETGIGASQIEVYGNLTPMYVFGSCNLVMPVIGIGSKPETYHVDVDEIECVVDVPLSTVGSEHVGTTVRHLAGVYRQVPCFDVCGAEIWGASAMMLAELSALMSDFCR